MRYVRTVFIQICILMTLLLTQENSSAQVVISQVYGGGGNSGATLTNDFIELFNSGTSAVSLTGWSVQYASATGTTWQVTSLSGTIQPGQYYLVQETAGAGGTTPLPTPDASGSIAMSATSGKVALVNTTVALSGSCPTGLVDFVGYGASASCFEGSGPTATLSNTTAALRASDGCTDNNNNSADFATGAPNPRNTASPLHVCGTASNTLVVTTASNTVDGVTTSIAALIASPGADNRISLAEAITATNNTAGADVIQFAIPASGVQTIAPTTALPTITDPVIIDGYTQPGAAPATAGSDAIIKIMLDGGGTIGVGLTIESDGSLIRGLAIGGFGDNGIRILGSENTIAGNFVGIDASGNSPALNNIGVLITGSSAIENTIGGTTPADRNIISANVGGVGIQSGSAGNKVFGNYVGTDVSGTIIDPDRTQFSGDEFGNSTGIGIVNAPGNFIGGSAAGEGNLISGNSFGVLISFATATGNQVQGNLIGTDKSGTVIDPDGIPGNGDELGNLLVGVYLSDQAHDNLIGGADPGAGNVIAGNGYFSLLGGVFIGTYGTLVQGNFIGTDATGTISMPNFAIGITIFGISGNLVGGTGTGEGNIIAYNQGVGVLVTSDTGGSILGNSIFSNTELGIDLSPSTGADGVTLNDPGDGDTGGNNLQNFPVLSAATTDGSGSITITGTFNSTPSTGGFRLEFFANDVCDPSEHGEGETFLGFTTVSTDGSGDASFSVTLSATVPVGAFITATATAPDNNTSEFSQCVETVAPGKPFVFLANKITLSSTKQVPSYGDMHSNGTLTVNKGDNSTYYSNLTAVGKITIGKYNIINGDVTSQTSISNSGKINGTKTIGSVNTEPLPSLSYAAGGPNKTVSNGHSLSLAPGSYGIVTLNENSTLKLTSGEYFMDELRYSSTIKDGVIEIDLSSGNPVTINVVSNLQLGHSAAIRLLPNGESDSKLVTFNTLQTTNADWGRQAYLVGSFNAPNAIVTLVKNTQLRGAICAKEIYVSTDCLFLHHDSPGSLPGPGDLPKSSEADESDVATSEVVTDYALEQNYPNPFSQIPRFAGNPTTTISFALLEAGDVSLAIYNTNGQLVKKLVAGEMNAGRHSVIWDATNARGERVASGVYLYVIEAANFTAQKKLVLMK